MLKKGVMLSKPGVNLYAQDMRSKMLLQYLGFKCIIKIGFCLQLATLRWHICLSSGNNSSVIGQESVNETLKIEIKGYEMKLQWTDWMQIYILRRRKCFLNNIRWSYWSNLFFKCFCHSRNSFSLSGRQPIIFLIQSLVMKLNINTSVTVKFFKLWVIAAARKMA